MFERVKMVFLPFRAVVGIGIQKIESLGVKLEEMKIWSLFATVLILFATVLSCYSARVELQFLVSCYSARVATVTDNKICSKTARICFKRLYWVLGL